MAPAPMFSLTWLLVAVALFVAIGLIVGVVSGLGRNRPRE